MVNGKKPKRAESANPTLRSGTGNNKLNFNAKDITQMKRIEAVMRENGKNVPTKNLVNSGDKTSTSTNNFVNSDATGRGDSISPISLSNQKNIIQPPRGIDRGKTERFNKEQFDAQFKPELQDSPNINDGRNDEQAMPPTTVKEALERSRKMSENRRAM